MPKVISHNSKWNFQLGHTKIKDYEVTALQVHLSKRSPIATREYLLGVGGVLAVGTNGANPHAHNPMELGSFQMDGQTCPGK